MKFKVGDKVRCVCSGDVFPLTEWKVYTITNIGNDAMVEVLTDTGDPGYYVENRFEPYVGEYKKGDRVEVRGDGGDIWNERQFVMDLGDEFDNRYLCRSILNSRIVTGWRYIRKVSKTTEVTLDEIAEKFNIPVEQLKIKK